MDRNWWRAAVVASAGFSAVETSVVLLSTTLLSATAAPHVQEYLDQAHLTKAVGDVKVIAVSIIRLTFDVGRIGRHLRQPSALLVSDGQTPDATLPDARPWIVAVNDDPQHSLGAHLVDNAAGYPVAGGRGFGWKGPYMDGLSADPWGSRYAVNVGKPDRQAGESVIVLSPGPNRLVETPFDMVGLRLGGDDIAGLIGRR